MEFKDVIHFYLGCDIRVYEPDGSYFNDVMLLCYPNENEVWGRNCECVPLSDVKLELRSIHHMRVYEDKIYKSLCREAIYDGKEKQLILNVDTPESFAYMVKRRFDIFDLIAKGNAVLKQNQYSSAGCLEQWLGNVKNPNEFEMCEELEAITSR